jgi:hypothetical protein
VDTMSYQEAQGYRGETGFDAQSASRGGYIETLNYKAATVIGIRPQNLRMYLTVNLSNHMSAHHTTLQTCS